MKSIIRSTEDVQAVLEGRRRRHGGVVKEDRRGVWAAVNGVRNNSEYGASVPCYLHRETAVDDISAISCTQIRRRRHLLGAGNMEPCTSSAKTLLV